MNNVLPDGRQPGFVNDIGVRLDTAVHRCAEQLLGIGSIEDLATSLIDRASLARGRVEAYEFGRGQHSSASAGAMLAGLAGVPLLANHVLEPFFGRVSRLVRSTGTMYGHDGDRVASTTSWAISQVLLGLSIGARRLGVRVPRVHKMVAALLRLQDPASGGWPLRPGEDARPVFSFYAVLALAHVWRSGADRSDELVRSLGHAYDYLARCLRQSVESLEELSLAFRALVALRRVMVDAGLATTDLDLPGIADSLRERAWSPTGGVLLRNRTIATYRQPTWHMTLWRPLFSLAMRGDSSPLSPLDALLGHELVGAFSKDVRAWCGPEDSSARNGSSWASALALTGTFLLASDLVRHGITVDQWLNRCRELESEAFEFDVAISFAGADRQVASDISTVLSKAGYRVFYDLDQQHRLLGEDLTEYLYDMYFRRSRYAIVVVSAEFLRSKWAGNWEWRAVLARLQSQREAYVLPYLLDEVLPPGLSPSIGYVSVEQRRPVEFADIVVRKLRTRPQNPSEFRS